MLTLAGTLCWRAQQLCLQCADQRAICGAHMLLALQPVLQRSMLKFEAHAGCQLEEQSAGREFEEVEH